MKKREIHCCGCNRNVNSRLTNGAEIYPHREDLRSLPFWICETCFNYVGCHHKTKNPTQPLGCIPTSAIRDERKNIHYLLDPIWKDGHIKRKKLYEMVGDRLGKSFHTSDIRSVDEAEAIISIISGIRQELK